MQRVLRYMAMPAVAALAAFFMVSAQTGGNVTVKIVDAPGGGYRYEPVFVHVEPGQRVAFVNETRATHTATCQGACGWDSGDIQPGQTVFVRFATAKAWPFVCRYHRSRFETALLSVGTAPSPSATPT